MIEILKSTLRTREYIEQGEKDGRSLLDAINDGELDGMRSFDGEIERLVREGVLTYATGLLYSTNPGNLQVRLADFAPQASVPAAASLDVDDIESLIER